MSYTTQRCYDIDLILPKSSLSEFSMLNAKLAIFSLDIFFF